MDRDRRAAVQEVSDLLARKRQAEPHVDLTAVLAVVGAWALCAALVVAVVGVVSGWWPW